jgi:TonB family protein
MATHVSDTGSKGRTRGSSADELALIAQRAQAFTNAAGTAIALSEGSVDEIICRARSGSNAPEVGTAMRVEGSFTGLCIQSGKELRCDDAETDTRVDTSAIRALGIRSMVVTPIKEENRVVGVLAVFAPTAHAFTITHVAVLKTMADQISALLQKERRAKEEGVGGEPAPQPSPTAAPRAVTAMPQAIPVAPSAPTPAMMAPANFAPATAPPTPEQVPALRTSFPVVSKKIEPIKTTVVADDVATPVVLPKREEKAKLDVRPPEVRPNLATFDAAGEEKKSGVSLILIGVVAVVVIGAVGTFAFLKLHKPASLASATPPHVQEPPNTPVTPAGATTSSAPGTTASSPLPASPATNGSAPPASRPDNGPTETSRKADKPPVKSSPPEKTSQPERSIATNTNAPEKRPTPETVALAAAPSKIAAGASGGDSGAAPESTPALNLGASSGSGALSALAKPADSSKPSMLAQSNLEPVQVLRRVAPIYPPMAKQRRLSGVLVVQATVGKDGKLTNLELVSGPPLFRDAAFDAVRQWQFKPAMLNGQPIEQSTTIKLQFNP